MPRRYGARRLCGSAACSAMGSPQDRKASRRTRRSHSTPPCRAATARGGFVGALRAARWGRRKIEKHRGALAAPTAPRHAAPLLRAQALWERCVQRDGVAARSKTIAAHAPLPQHPAMPRRYGARRLCGSAACSAMGLPQDRKASRRTRRSHTPHPTPHTPKPTSRRTARAARSRQSPGRVAQSTRSASNTVSSSPKPR